MGGEPRTPQTFSSKKEMLEYMVREVDNLITAPHSPLKPQDAIAHMILSLANVSSILFYAYNALHRPGASLDHLMVNWVGFYLLNSVGDSLTLGPFQGRVACTKIKVGKGVCGTAVLHGATQVVPDVHAFPGHIGCDSDSNSEIVVPLREVHTDGRLVGVLDIDSTELATFDEQDKDYLEQVVRLLGERLTFPLRPPVRPFGAADVPPHAPPLVSGIVPTPPVAPAGGPTTRIINNVKDLPSDNQLPPEVVPQVKRVHGWEFLLQEQSRIQSHTEQDELQRVLKVHSVPEITFPVNALRIVNPSATIALQFNAFSVLQSAAQFYASSSYHDTTNHYCDNIAIPSCESWKKSLYSVFDAKIDWAWRHRFFGIVAHENDPHPVDVVDDDTAVIDWDLLKRTDTPILMYSNIPLFEDDLHDNGTVLCAVRFRVMHECFFVLLRHAIHVHGSGVSVRDVRIFHKFGETLDQTMTTTGSSSRQQHQDGGGGDDAVHPFPSIVIEEQWRRGDISENTLTQWTFENLDAKTAAVPVVLTRRLRVVPHVAASPQ